MKCPACGHPESKSIISPSDFMARVHKEMGEYKRRRECQKCHNRWATIELPQEELQRLRGLACQAMLERART